MRKEQDRLELVTELSRELPSLLKISTHVCFLSVLSSTFQMVNQNSVLKRLTNPHFVANGVKFSHCERLQNILKMFSLSYATIRLKIKYIFQKSIHSFKFSLKFVEIIWQFLLILTKFISSSFIIFPKSP